MKMFQKLTEKKSLINISKKLKSKNLYNKKIFKNYPPYFFKYVTIQFFLKKNSFIKFQTNKQVSNNNIYIRCLVNIVEVNFYINFIELNLYFKI